MTFFSSSLKGKDNAASQLSRVGHVKFAGGDPPQRGPDARRIRVFAPVSCARLRNVCAFVQATRKCPIGSW